MLTCISTGAFEPIIHLADAHSQSISQFTLPGAQRMNAPFPFTVHSMRMDLQWICSAGCALQIIPLARALKIRSMCLVCLAGSSCTSLSCPEQLLQCFSQIQNEGSSPHNPATSVQLLNEVARQVLLEPIKGLVAVVWQYFEVRPQEFSSRIVCVGLSIHSAVTGDLQAIRLLSEATSGDAYACEPSCLPCSSNFAYVSDGGLLHVITPSGSMLWSSARADRNPDMATVPATHMVQTVFSPSPCGRWILVMDVEDPLQFDPADMNTCTWQLTLPEASTGQPWAGCLLRDPASTQKAVGACLDRSVSWKCSVLSWSVVLKQFLTQDLPTI